MRRFGLAVFCVAVLSIGCVDARVKRIIGRQRIVLEEYVKRMDAEKTTPQQDQAALKAQLRNWQAVDHYFNGRKGPQKIGE